MDIGDFKQFSEQKFNLTSSIISRIKEYRKRPQIPLATAVNSIVQMVALGQRSLLEVDQHARSPAFKAWHAVKRRMVVSDSTLERILGNIDLEEARAVLHKCVQVVSAEAALSVELSSGRSIRIGVVDGSNFGGFSGCVFAIAGMVATPVDIQMHNKGKELVASRQLLSRISRSFGKRFVDIVVGDGLYMTKDHIRQCKEELGCESLVKTTEKGLSVVQDAEQLFAAADGLEGIEYAEGIDIERGIKYKVMAAGGFQWDGLPYKLKVAKVEEEKLKPKPGQERYEVFWVITTDQSLSAEELRELAHKRWQIENNIFKRLNELVGSKRGWIRSANLKAILLILWFTGLLVFSYWLLLRGLAKLMQTYGKVKKTWRFVTRLLFTSIERLSLVKS